MKNNPIWLNDVGNCLPMSASEITIGKVEDMNLLKGKKKVVIPIQS